MSIMETFGTMELDMSQTWMSPSCSPQKKLGNSTEKDDDKDFFISTFKKFSKSSSNDDFSVSTPTTVMTGGTSSSFFESCGSLETLETLDLLNDNEDLLVFPSPRMDKPSSRKSLQNPPTKTPEGTKRLNNSFSDLSSTKKLNNSSSEPASPPKRIDMDGTITLIPSKAREAQDVKKPLVRRFSAPLKLDGGKRAMRGRRPTRRSAVASDQVGKSPLQRARSTGTTPRRRSAAVVPDHVGKSPLQRTRSLGATTRSSSSSPPMKLSSKPLRGRVTDRRSSIKRRNEVESSILEALAAFDDDCEIIPVPPTAPKKTSVSKVTPPRDEASRSPAIPTTVPKKTSVSKATPPRDEASRSPATKNSDSKTESSESANEEETKSPSSTDRRSDFKVLYARTPSTSSARVPSRASGGSSCSRGAPTRTSSSSCSRGRDDKSRVSELCMKVKQSRASFQKMVDASAVEPTMRTTNRSATIAPHTSATNTSTSRSMNERESFMEKQLREKEEMIAKLQRELEEARALNQEKTREIRRIRRPAPGASKPERKTSECSTTAVRRKSRRSSLPGITQSRALSPSNLKQRCKAKKEDSESISTKRKKQKAFRAKDPSQLMTSSVVTKQQPGDTSSESSSRRKLKHRVSRSSTTALKLPRRSTTRLEGKASKGLNRVKIMRTKSDGQMPTIRRSRA